MLIYGNLPPTLDLPGKPPSLQLPVPGINERQLCEVLALRLTLFEVLLPSCVCEN